MIKKILILLSILFSFMIVSAQNVDTIIVNKEYKSYFSYEVKNPLYVIYKLYKGGGDTPRTGMVFKTGGLKYSLTEKEYTKSGYDIGHLANAKDFANNKQNEELTFRFYNAVPQTPRLNRGIWKTYETNIRELSQKDSLLIICGGYNYNKINNLYVPMFCFKIVKDLVTNKISCYVFPNDNSEKVSEISIESFFLLSKYNKIYIEKNLK